MDGNEKLRRIYSEIIDAINGTDLNSVYSRSLDIIYRIDDVDVVMVYIVDDDSANAVLMAHRNASDGYISRAGAIPRGKGITWEILHNPRIVTFDDVQTDSRLGIAGRELGVRGCVGVPIFTENRCIGVIWFFSYRPEAFSKEKNELLYNIGQLLAVTISRLKQKEDVQRNNSRLTTLSSLSVYLNSTSDLNEILKTMNHIIDQNDLIDKMAIYLVDKDDTKTAKLVAHSGLSAGMAGKYAEIGYPDSVTWECIRKGEIIYYSREKLESSEAGRIAMQENISSIISIPVIVDNEIIGCTNFLNFTTREYREDDLRFIEALGSLIGSVIARIEINKNIRKMAITDNLSNLYNSRYFNESLLNLFHNSKRTGTKISLVLVDVDDFKKFNDQYGHLVGDKVIEKMGEAIRGSVRKMDIPARYGGDEFAVILPSTGVSSSKTVAYRIHESIKVLSVEAGKRNVSIGTSIGVATITDNTFSSEDLMRMADISLYRSKSKGKGEIIHYSELDQEALLQNK